MAEERIQSISDRYRIYLRNRIFAKRHKQQVASPIDAVTFELVEISDDKPVRSDEYGWLSSLVSAIPDDEVARKMKKHRNTYETIEEALTDKIIMESI